MQAMDKNPAGTTVSYSSVSAQPNSANDFHSQCILCLNNCEKVNISSNDPDVDFQELTSSLCRLIQLPHDPFVNYFLQDNILFCTPCMEVLHEIHRQLGNLTEIEKQLNVLKNAVQTNLFLLTGTPIVKRKKGRPTKSSKCSIDNIRKEIARILKKDKAITVDLNFLVSAHIIGDDDGGGGMEICETGTEEVEQKQSLLNPVVVSSFSVFEEFDIEDVKVFPSEVDFGTTNQESLEDRPTRKRKSVTLKNSYLEPPNSDGDSGGVESDWVPSEEERITRSGSTKNKLKQKRRSKTVCRKDPTKTLKCSFESCTASFEIGREDLLAVHIRRVHEGVKKPFLCPHCPETFRLKYRFENHVRKIHTGERPFICEVCGKSFRLKVYLKIHSSVHAVKERDFACQRCPMKFFSYAALGSHTQRKHVDAVHMCELCSLTFATDNGLKDHQRQVHFTELGLNPHQCGTCHKIFSTAFVLRDHQKTHTGEGLLQCPTCDYRATSKSTLNAHMKKHTSDKPYKCTFNDKCRFSCRFPSALRRHLRGHNDVRPYKCSSCTRTFRSSAQLRNHEGAIHSGLTPFECPHCGEKFPIKKYWHRHVKKHLNGKLSAPKVSPKPNLSASSTVNFNAPPFN